MTKTELKKATKERLLKIGYKTIDQTFYIDTKEQAVLVSVLWNGKGCTSVYTVYVNFKIEYATIQLLSTVAVHEERRLKFFE